MSVSASVLAERTDGLLLVRIVGAIDDLFPTAVLKSLLEEPPATTVVVDFDEVRRVTSYGVRQWTSAIADLGQRPVYFINCRPSTVTQLSTIPAFRGAAQIASIYVPFVCPNCDHASEVVVDVAADAAVRSGKPPPAGPCPKCGSTTEFDDVASTYFRCVVGSTVQVPPAVAPLIAAKAGPPTPSAAAASPPSQAPHLSADHSDDATRPGSPTGFIGKYRVIRRLGLGGMAEVWLASRGADSPQDYVVIKRILPHLSAHPGFIQQFLDEGRVVARLKSPFIVEVLDLEKIGTDFHMVLEFIDGPDLQTIIKWCIALQETIPPAIAAAIMARVCAGLAVAHDHRDAEGHARPVIHRDVSPHNVLVGRDGAAKLTDFGVAKAADSLNQTEVGLIKGKVLYMAPELVLGQPLDGRADVFAAGMCLYYAIVRAHPFQQGTELASLKAVLDARIPRLAEISVAPPELSDIVMRALERAPEKRIQSAAELASLLNGFAARSINGDPGPHVAAWLKGLDARFAARPADTANDVFTVSELERTVATPFTPRREAGSDDRERTGS